MVYTVYIVSSGKMFFDVFHSNLMKIIIYRSSRLGSRTNKYSFTFFVIQTHSEAGPFRPTSYIRPITVSVALHLPAKLIQMSTYAELI